MELKIDPKYIPTYQQFKTVRQRTLDICQKLEPEDAVVQPMEDVSPAKWHLAHTSWFFERFILLPEVEGYEEFDPTFNYLFNSYYNSQGKRVDRDRRGFQTRPRLQRVYDYRKHVDEAMANFFSRKGKDGYRAEVVMLGIQHEQQHQELLITDLKYILFQNHLDTGFLDEALIKPQSGDGGRIKIEEGLKEIGANTDSFCFDNERPRHRIYQVDASIDRLPILNREFMEFIEDGGYSDPLLWLSDGWSWRQENGVTHPLYWIDRGDHWQEYTCAGRKAWRPDAPVAHINYYEASAFAQWKGARLCTEAERELADPVVRDNNQLWEWTSSAYQPYPGFEAWEGEIGEYNGKFMVNQMVLKGGSVATSPGHYRSTYRNFFHPDKRWQFTGVRLAK
jgi:ergothioneine biosynthesis protein EgtB